MAIQDDISVAANGDIRYTGSVANYRPLEIHRLLQDLADNATSAGDDLLDITDINPSVRFTDEIIELNAPYNIDDTLAQHIYGGSISQDSGDTLYSGLRVIGSVGNSNTQLIIEQNGAALTSFWSTGINTEDGSLNRLVIKTRTGGADINNKKVTVLAREYGDTYDSFEVTLGQGEGVAAISTQSDPNNNTAEATVATAAAAIDLTFGLQTFDLGNGNGSLEYALSADLNGDTIADWYEISKWICRRGNTTTYNGIQGQLIKRVYTHTVVYDAESGGPFTEGELLTFSGGGTARLVALDDDGATGNLYIHMVTGNVAIDNETITGGTSSATANVNGTPASVSGKFNGPFGNLAGGTFFGSEGIYVEDMAGADVQKVSFIDLAGNPQTPPNSVGISLTSLISGDYGLVGRDNGSGSIDKLQYTIAANNNSGNGTLVISETIDGDNPSSGVVRVENPTTGKYDRYTYTSFTGSTFTLSGTLSTTYTSGDAAFVPFIDEVSTGTSITTTIIQTTDIDVIAKVRNASTGNEIQPFETTGTIGSAGVSITAIRTSDA